MVSRALIRDNSISPECRWLIIYLLANQDGWKICAREIINHCKGQISRDRVYAIINEAIAAGYIRREEEKVNGKFKSIRYFVSETPKPLSIYPLPELPDTEKRDNKEEASIKNIVCVTRTHAREEEKKLEFGRVRLSKTEHETLLSEYGAEKIAFMIKELDEYADINPKHFKEYGKHATVIRKWIRKEAQNRENQPWKPNKKNYQTGPINYKPDSSVKDSPEQLLAKQEQNRKILAEYSSGSTKNPECL